MKNSNKFEKTVFFFENENSIKNLTSSSYADFVRDFADETTSPRGVEPRFHIRKKKGDFSARLKDEDEFIIFENSKEAYCFAKDVNSKVVEKRYDKDTYELWTWGVRGNHPKVIETFDEKKDANFALLETFEQDMHNENQRCTICFNTKKEAIIFLEKIIK